MGSELSRRDVLRGAALVGAGALLSAAGRPAFGAAPAHTAAPAAARTRALRLAHLTDIHVQPERGAGEGLAMCLRHVHAQADKPALIVTGGDLVMDSYGSDDARTNLQWELFTKTLRDHNALRVEHTLGNHDLWGWDKEGSKTSGSEPAWGKRRALDALGMNERYHSYDVGGWHLVHLDSTHPHPSSPKDYIAKIDEAQMDWLARDLASVKVGVHTLVISHIPILTITAQDGAPGGDGAFRVSGSLMHTDSAALRALFEKAGSVRACLSGHMHRRDQIDFRGVRYCCNGAVCGAWWKGPNQEADEGYALVDLFDDGTVESRYVTYGWQARE